VVPRLTPGEIRAQLPTAPPDRPEPLEQILADYLRLIEPNVTHWQHPGFMAYFPSVASGPGILGEWLSATLNSNVMFWRNAPASTELEERIVDWLRQMLGLPPIFDGMLVDTASVATLLSVVAAREAVPNLDGRQRGLAGRPETGRLRLYASTEAHSSIDKAAIVSGVGLEGLRRIPVDAAWRMRPEELARAVAEDRREGWLPFCVVATLGTTSSTSLDPAADIAEVCQRERLWFHVDAAYGGAAALMPERRELLRGWERADSIVFNPHKWMFTPFDATLLLFSQPERYRDAFCLVPEYLRASEQTGAHNFSEYGIQLGRRFRALKLWMLLRWFGTEGIAEQLREHCRLAGELARWVDDDPEWELMAPVPLATVCLRHRPPAIPATDAERLDTWNAALLDEVHRSGRIYLSHTRLNGHYTLRVSLGNPRQRPEHVADCWSLLQAAARAVAASSPFV
jgi:aromatic-L-amino-acid decarboxylase